MADEIDKCPACGEACHASEGTEDGYHPGCLLTLFGEQIDQLRDALARVEERARERDEAIAELLSYETLGRRPEPGDVTIREKRDRLAAFDQWSRAPKLPMILGESVGARVRRFIAETKGGK